MLVALHGFTETDLVWSEFFNGHHPVRCPVLPGHGAKPCPPGTTLASVAAAMAKHLNANGGDDLLGYSLGGRVALQLALDHPGKVRRLVLLSSGPGIADASERAKRLKRDERLAQILEEDGISPFTAWWESTPALKPFKPLSRPVDEALRSMRLNQDPQCLAGVLRHLSHGAMEDLAPRLANLRIPVLLIAGDSDTAYCQRMREMAAALPNSRLQLIADAGHAVHREKPEAVRNSVVTFLREH
jgi:2-succinyl-6-hydroxy-2,4-cyclohexadiene-1-carboxylate synthase